MNSSGEMQARIRSDLKEAMKARRTEETSVLRTLLTALDNAQAPALASRLHATAGAPSEVDRLVLAPAETQAVMLQEIRSLDEAAAELARVGQGERADALTRQASLARRYIEPTASTSAVR